MPVIAVSPPLVFGATPTPTPRPGVTPRPTPTIVPGISGFVARHEQFIDRIDGLSACFKREELNDFADQEFLDHSQVAIKDRYLAHEKGMYCSMQGVNALTKTLRRLGEE